MNIYVYIMVFMVIYSCKNSCTNTLISNPINVVRFGCSYIRKDKIATYLIIRKMCILWQAKQCYCFFVWCNTHPIKTLWLNFIINEKYPSCCLRKWKINIWHISIHYGCLRMGTISLRWDWYMRKKMTIVCIWFWKFYRNIVLRSKSGWRVNCRHVKNHCVTCIT